MQIRKKQLYSTLWMSERYHNGSIAGTLALTTLAWSCSYVGKGKGKGRDSRGIATCLIQYKYVFDSGRGTCTERLYKILVCEQLFNFIWIMKLLIIAQPSLASRSSRAHDLIPAHDMTRLLRRGMAEFKWLVASLITESILDHGCA